MAEHSAAHPLAGMPPSKIIAVHLSYRSRSMERGRLPLWPSYFLKPPSTLAGDGATVRRPPWCELLASARMASPFPRNNLKATKTTIRPSQSLGVLTGAI